MYEKYLDGELTLRDHLARDRTVLANERTLLAYLRTFLGLLAAGVTLLKLFPNDSLLVTMGISGIVISSGVLLVGLIRFVRFARRYRSIEISDKTK